MLPFDLAGRRVWVAGHRGLVGSALVRRLEWEPIGELITATSDQVDLRRQVSNEGYAIAKIATLELAKMYRRQYGINVISLMPTNLYGPGDNYDPENSHVLAALIRKIHEAKVTGSPTVEVWGTGTPRREFLYSDDLADAAVFALKNYEGEEHLNVGTGKDISIRELAELIAELIGWSGEFVFDPSKPDGMQ